MTLNAAGSLLGSIVMTGAAIRDLIDKWNWVSQELKDFDQTLDRLRVERQAWEAQIHRLGLSTDREFLDLFRKAQLDLDGEKSKLAARRVEGGYGLGCRCLPHVKWSCCPAELPKIIRRVTKVFDEVLNNLERQREIATELQKRVLSATPTLGCRPDHRYIRLEETNRKVMAAVRDSDGPAVVLLHGGPGKGKSSLARDVALQIQQQIDKVGAPDDAVISHDTRQASTVFEQVVFLECGPNVDLQAQQIELREKLGWLTNANPAAHADAAREPESEITLNKSLSCLLKDKALLLILDDVWKSRCEFSTSSRLQPNFLQRMISLGGKHVKWLVTSQLGDLCNPINCKFIPIRIEDVTQDTARRILAVHIGLQETAISEVNSEVQGIVDRIVHQVDANPLALTCVAPAVDKERYNHTREWEGLEKDLSDLLDSKPITQMQSTEYSRSYWEAIQVGFQILNPAEQNLLVLMHMCKGPHIREEIIEYLFEHTRGSDCHQNFSLARRVLKDRHHVEMAAVNDNVTGGKKSTWSIHILLRQFIREKYFVSKKNDLLTAEILSRKGIMVFDRGISRQLESRLVIAMGFLYFEREFSEELINKYAAMMDIPPCTFEMASSRAHVIEPIAPLLMLNENKMWTSALHSSTREVFLKYSESGVIDQNGASMLLSSSVSNCHMLATLIRLSETYPNFFFGQMVISSLVKLLERECIFTMSGTLGGVSSRPAWHLLDRIAPVLGRQLRKNELCNLDENDKFHLSNTFEHLRAGLTNVLADDLQICSAKALGDLVTHNEYISRKAVTAQGLLEELVMAITNDDCRLLQLKVTRLIANLATNSSYVGLKIVNCLGTCEALVAGMKRENSKTLQTYSAAALSNLASHSSRIRLKVLNCGGVLQALLAGLNKDKNKVVQKRSSLALVNLAGTSDEAKRKIVTFDGALEKFMIFLGGDFKDDKSTCRKEYSARALAYLSSGGHQIKEEMMVKCPGLLDALISAVNPLICDGTNETKDGRGTFICDSMIALTLLNPGKAKDMHLDSAAAYLGRGVGMLQLSYYQESLQDFDEYEACLHGSFLQDAEAGTCTSARCCAKARLGDLEGALAEANLRMEITAGQFALQERGIVKRMMGDLRGALTDLDAGLRIDPEDFEALKHRGYVKYLMQDEEGARGDAERARKVEEDYGHCLDYNSSRINLCLGATSVQYLNFKF